MDKERRQSIHSIAEKIHDILEVTEPINMDEIIDKLGGKLVRKDLSDFLDAKIEKKKDSFQIIYNKKKPDTRNNFSIAHELGHLFIHMGYKIYPKKWNQVKSYSDQVFYRYGKDREEHEANEFAAAFLMPKEKFRQAVDKYTDDEDMCDIQKLADHFGVSKEAALNRGRWLNIFSWEPK